MVELLKDDENMVREAACIGFEKLSSRREYKKIVESYANIFEAELQAAIEGAIPRIIALFASQGTAIRSSIGALLWTLSQNRKR